MTIYDPSLPPTIYAAHDPLRTYCPSTRRPCHNLSGCRFTSCHYGHGSLTKAPAAPAQGDLLGTVA